MTESYAYYDFVETFDAPDFSLDGHGIKAGTSSSLTVDTTTFHSGPRSIQVAGEIGNADHWSISSDFLVPNMSIEGAAGGSYDFSAKVVVLSVFIPAGSPIGEIWFEAYKGADYVTVAAAKMRVVNDPLGIGWTTSLPKGEWVEAVIDIKPGPWPYARKGGGEVAGDGPEARDMVEHCEVFNISGRTDQAWTGGLTASHFFLDDLRWLDRDHVRVDGQVDSIRKYCVKSPRSCLQSLVDAFVYAIVEAIKAAFDRTRGQQVGGHAPRSQIYVGSHAEYADVFSVADAKLPQLLAQELNLVCVQPHWCLFEPNQGEYKWDEPDAMVEFAIDNNMAVYSYMGGWHQQLPAWAAKDRALSDLGPALIDFIAAVGHRYKGNIAIWTVFNEIVNDKGDGVRNRQTPDPDDQPPASSPCDVIRASSPWVGENDLSLIEAAFREARNADPTAKLLLNDFNIEEIGRPKSEKFYETVQTMLSHGTPIDAVGFEMYIAHPYWGDAEAADAPTYATDLQAYLANVTASVERYADLGLLVSLSEVSVPLRIGTGLPAPVGSGLPTVDPVDPAAAAQVTRQMLELKESLEYQAQVYDGLMRIALDNWNVLAYNIWDCTDRYSYASTAAFQKGAPGYGQPGMFDTEYKPKPAYDSVLKTLKGWSTS